MVDGIIACTSAGNITIRAYVQGIGNKQRLELNAATLPVKIEGESGHVVFTKKEYIDGVYVLIPVKAPSWDIIRLKASISYSGKQAEVSFYVIDSWFF